jgi:hypothetical protein
VLNSRHVASVVQVEFAGKSTLTGAGIGIGTLGVSWSPSRVTPSASFSILLTGVTGELKVLFSAGKVGLDLLILNER